jgi:ABC-type transport system involved in Fe-S cluster assembly fused permease/ATPase subunit
MSSFDEDAYKDANLLAGDAINNYRTVSSFGHDNLIVKQYHDYVVIPERG